MSIHKSVLLKETIDGLNLSEQSICFLDGTFGGGGHAREICKQYPKILVLACDEDANTWKDFSDKDLNIKFFNTNFENVEQVLEEAKVDKLDGILLDLGISSDQLENRERGFSFLKDEPLLMTLKDDPKEEDLTAHYIVNNWGEESLANIIYGYGEEQFSRRIAKKIVEKRTLKEIKTTFELVEIIREAVPFFYTKNRLHFATKTFQAIRIAVNDELGVLERALEKGFRFLKTGGRFSVISFHSLEDRIVKLYFRKLSDEKKAILINKRPITASEEELKENPRSRSAKLRILEKIIS
jgi:16S rRNA (cytosine1402-N4)-methyltransferase